MSDALIGDRSRPPQVLPDRRTTLADRGSISDCGLNPAPLTLFLTVDTEDAYFTRPRLMTGAGIGEDYGVFGIAEELEARGMSATFFVNVYESERQPRGVVESVVRRLDERGHEIGLHTHPSPSLEFYRRPLFRLDAEQQRRVIEWGADLIERWTGSRPVSFRAGGYALDEHTYPALAAAGIEVDSSWFFPSPNNKLERTTVNAVTAHSGMLEVPIPTVIRLNGERVEHRKVDLDWLSVDHLVEAVRSLALHGARFGCFMMHSFSFIAKETRKPEQAPSPDAIYRSEPLFNRYVEVYGPKPAMRVAFAEFLDRVAAEGSVQVRTMAAARSELPEAGDMSIPDVVPIVEA